MFKTLNEFIIIGLWWVEYFNTEEKGKATVTDLDLKSRPEQRDLKNLNKDCEKSEWRLKNLTNVTATKILPESESTLLS